MCFCVRTSQCNDNSSSIGYSYVSHLFTLNGTSVIDMTIPEKVILMRCLSWKAAFVNGIVLSAIVLEWTAAAVVVRHIRFGGLEEDKLFAV